MGNVWPIIENRLKEMEERRKLLKNLQLRDQLHNQNKVTSF